MRLDLIKKYLSITRNELSINTIILQGKQVLILLNESDTVFVITLQICLIKLATLSKSKFKPV